MEDKHLFLSAFSSFNLLSSCILCVNLENYFLDIWEKLKK